jgi:hypothetical protein
LGYHQGAPLPLYNARSFSKSVWDVKIGDVDGVANLVLTFGSELDALSGINGVGAEVSFRCVHVESDALDAY